MIARRSLQLRSEVSNYVRKEAEIGEPRMVTLVVPSRTIRPVPYRVLCCGVGDVDLS